MSKDKNENFDLDFEADDLFKINENYTILLNKKLGSGSFGQIYQCLNTKTNEILACKIESINELKPQLYHESKILLLMKNCTGFPTCYDFILTDQDKILIMDYLGRDIKPENFVIGPKNKERIIYLIDFGLSKKISNDKILPTIKADRNIIGTMRYISMNTHQGYEQGRRDDLESLFYIIIYFIKGELPWQNIKCKTRQEKYNKIFEIKKKVTEDGELVEDLPLEMKKILEYILGLNFAERPNYLMMKKSIELILNKLNYSNDLQFDWYNLDFLNYLYLTKNNMNEKEKIKENKKETKEETNKDKNIITNNIAMKLNTINNINGYNPKKLKFSYNKKIDNINNSYIRNKNNPVKQERSKSLMAIKRIYGQNITKKINNEYKKIKTYMEEKNDKGKLSNAVFNGKENVKIKNLRIKK